jgi:hypothetical protein
VCIGGEYSADDGNEAVVGDVDGRPRGENVGLFRPLLGLMLGPVLEMVTPPWGLWDMEALSDAGSGSCDDCDSRLGFENECGEAAIEKKDGQMLM